MVEVTSASEVLYKGKAQHIKFSHATTDAVILLRVGAKCSPDLHQNSAENIYDSSNV